MLSSKRNAARQPSGRRAFSDKSPRRPILKLHPLFLAVGVYYAFSGELFLFLLSALVAVQHECAHAFASASLGYKLNRIVLMPYGAVIDGDLKGISLKDELLVAFCGPLCNLLTALFFVALWWLTPTMYAFTDVACYSSLTVGLVNLLPAYPLDGGRMLKCLLAEAFLKRDLDESRAETRASFLCRALTWFFALLLFIAFAALLLRGTWNFSLLAFAVFLTAGALGNRDKGAVYDKMDLSCRNVLAKGAEIKRVAVLDTCTVKKTIRFLSKGRYLILEVYDKNERHLFNLSQNEFSDLFLLAPTPYATLGELYERSTRKNI